MGDYEEATRGLHRALCEVHRAAGLEHGIVKLVCGEGEGEGERATGGTDRFSLCVFVRVMGIGVGLRGAVGFRPSLQGGPWAVGPYLCMGCVDGCGYKDCVDYRGVGYFCVVGTVCCGGLSRRVVREVSSCRLARCSRIRATVLTVQAAFKNDETYDHRKEN